MITSASYQGLSFNDNENLTLTALPGLSNPPVRFEAFDVPLAHYGVFVAAYYGRRAFALEGYLIAESVEAFVSLRQQLSTAFSIFNGEQPLVLTLLDGQTRTIECVASGEVEFHPTTESPVACQFRIPLHASFPFLVSGSGSAITLGTSVTGGGDVPADVPMDLSSNSGGAAYIINAGNAPSYPTARITGPIANPALRNITANLDVQLNLTLLAGEYVDLDFRAKSVTDNTGRNRYDAFAGRWWTLAPGSSEVRLVSDDNNPSAIATLSAPDTYLSLS